MRYFFVLGRNPTLSLAELISVFDFNNLFFSFDKLSCEVAVGEINIDLKANQLIKTLGGTIKIGRIFDEVSFEQSELEFAKIFSTENLLKKYFSWEKGKIHFGISLYQAGATNQLLKGLERQQKEIALVIKENLKKAKVKSGFVQIKERFLSSVSVAKNRLLDLGGEIVLILTNQKILVGKTEAVQEFEAFSCRDYYRPKKNKKAGIIPPKLARIMINLAKLEKEKILLDPFCGSGTILQEAIILGYKNILGCDLKKTAIKDCGENLAWLFENFKELEKSSYKIKIFPGDIRMIARLIKPGTIDAIVTEPYLGPPFEKKPSSDVIKKNLREIRLLYLEAFSQFAKILKPQGKIIIVFPVFTENDKIQFVEVIEEIKNLGFKTKSFFPYGMKPPGNNLTLRETILYGNQEQFIKREILSFEKI